MAGGHQHSEGRHRTYNEERTRKLAEQAEVAKSTSGSGSQVLRGVKVYINGFLAGTTDIEMKRIVLEAGGVVLSTASGATHILTSQPLSGSKTHKILTKKARIQVHVVKPEWVFDSFLASLVVANNQGSNESNSTNAVVNLVAPDGSARATFVKTGATLTHFWVQDRDGEFRDIAIGFDNLTEYETAEAGTLYFGPVVGRYANRIRNGTFTIPISKDASGPGEKFEVPKNTNNGNDTLHGGFDGYNTRVWEVLTRSHNSVTFTLVDPDGKEGFPGFVFNTATYILDNNSSLKISLRAFATEDTPIMLSGHHFWNLEAYQESEDLSSHFMQFNSSRFVATDGNLIPNGELPTVEGTPLDFRVAKSIGDSIPDTAAEEYCGTDCVGFDNCWVYDNNTGTEPIFSVWSENSGIKLDVITDQPALQIYTCNGLDGTIPRKEEQGGPDATYGQHSCLVIEQQSIIDAINNPEFGVDQIYGPNRTYEWEAEYRFSVLQ
ncbi:hypothetical protein AAF712_005287 [Marasmius tenuissimus]|uniref:BRCT domain-containing protein n=1 Tax=Marasmius tenuissimus TaxID=585030 RepID=A0ABR3A4V1_9AGAR